MKHFTYKDYPLGHKQTEKKPSFTELSEKIGPEAAHTALVLEFVDKALFKKVEPIKEEDR